jgi:predicted RNase H-like HicB family nuclease
MKIGGSCPVLGNLAIIKAMKRIIQVRVFRGDSYFVAECFDLPVVTQAKTLDELMVNVKEAIALQLEGEDPADFGLAPGASILASYELEPEPQVHAKA